MFKAKKTVDGILGNFRKTVQELRDVETAELAAAEAAEARRQEAVRERDAAEQEAFRAGTVAANIEQLIGA